MLAIPVGAHAKGLVPSRVCGESWCVAFDARPEAMVTLDANASRPQPPTAPFYRLDYRGAGVPSHYFVPAKNLIGAGVDSYAVRWFALRGPALDEIRTAIRGLDPFPAPDAWGVTVSGERGTTPRPLGAVILLVALAVGALAALRFRVRRPTTA